MADNPPRGTPNRRRPQPEGGAQKGEAPQGEGPVLLKSIKSLERLRDRIQTAATEIIRMREENAALSSRLQRMESQPDIPENSALQLDEDPEVLRQKVSGFIEAIDRYLGGEQKS